MYSLSKANNDIRVIKGDSTESFEIYSNQIDVFDDSWTGKYSILNYDLETLIEGELEKSPSTYKEDSILFSELKVDLKHLIPLEEKEVCLVDRKEVNPLTESLVVTGNLSNPDGPLSNRSILVSVTDKKSDKSRHNVCFTDANGDFSCNVYLGNTIKDPEGKHFIFKLKPETTEQLEPGIYLYGIQLQKEENGEVVYRKEIQKARLFVEPELVLN